MRPDPSFAVFATLLLALAAPRSGAGQARRAAPVAAPIDTLEVLYRDGGWRLVRLVHGQGRSLDTRPAHTRMTLSYGNYQLTSAGRFAEMAEEGYYAGYRHYYRTGRYALEIRAAPSVNPDAAPLLGCPAYYTAYDVVRLTARQMVLRNLPLKPGGKGPRSTWYFEAN